MSIKNFLKGAGSSLSNSISGGVSERPNGAILPYGMESVRTPTMGADQRKQLESIQALLGKGAESSIQGLLNQGQSPIDKYAISNFERDIMPQITQGAAHNNLLGASGVAGAQADATSRLAEGLAAQKYNALGDLLGKYGQFSQLSPFKYSAYQKPETNWGDIANLLGGDRSQSSWAESIGELLGGGAGTAFGGIGTLAGSKIGKTAGKGIDWLISKLFGKGSGGGGAGGGGSAPSYQSEMDRFMSAPQY